MKNAALADWTGIWAVTWRSVVYSPLALAIWALLILWLVALVYLPIVAVVFASSGLYSWAAAAVALWLPILLLGTRRHILRFFFGSGARKPEKL